MQPPYKANDYQRLLGAPGFSDTLLKNHFKLYEGYVKNTNEIYDVLSQASHEGQTSQPSYAEMRRRFGWEFNGMRLHELYFDALGKDPGSISRIGALSRKITEAYGSVDDWKKEFTAIGAMRGIGWVALVHDPKHDRLLNIWINEHDAGHLAGTTTLLIMDVFEHAFMTDYGMDKPKYIAAFWNAVQWQEVERRFEASVPAAAAKTEE